MTSSSISSSPFLTHSVLDTLLSQSISAEERIQLLSAKIHLYANSEPSTQDAGTSTSEGTQGTRVMKDQACIPEMRTRLDLAAVQMEMQAEQKGARGTNQAENTLRIVLDWSKGVMKGIERRRKLSSAEGGERKDAEVGDGDANWIKEAMGIRKRALGMLIHLEEKSERPNRIEALRRQLLEVDAAGFG